MCSSGLGNGVRTHSSPQEAFGCKRKSLIAQNWEQIGAKEFRPPAGVNDGFILVLTRPGKYGAEMRGGKSGEKGTGKGRVMPKSGKSGYIA
jgi:hypothetical protein